MDLSIAFSQSHSHRITSPGLLDPNHEWKPEINLCLQWVVVSFSLAGFTERCPDKVTRLAKGWCRESKSPTSFIVSCLNHNLVCKLIPFPLWDFTRHPPSWTEVWGQNWHHKSCIPASLGWGVLFHLQATEDADLQESPGTWQLLCLLFSLPRRMSTFWTTDRSIAFREPRTCLSEDKLFYCSYWNLLRINCPNVSIVHDVWNDNICTGPAGSSWRPKVFSDLNLNSCSYRGSAVLLELSFWQFTCYLKRCCSGFGSYSQMCKRK
jgi:hypothetical protein